MQCRDIRSGVFAVARSLSLSWCIVGWVDGWGIRVPDCGGVEVFWVGRGSGWGCGPEILVVVVCRDTGVECGVVACWGALWWSCRETDDGSRGCEPRTFLPCVLK